MGQSLRSLFPSALPKHSLPARCRLPGGRESIRSSRGLQDRDLSSGRPRSMPCDAPAPGGRGILEWSWECPTGTQADKATGSGLCYLGNVCTYCVVCACRACISGKLSPVGRFARGCVYGRVRVLFCTTASDRLTSAARCLGNRGSASSCGKTAQCAGTKEEGRNMSARPSPG